MKNFKLLITLFTLSLVFPLNAQRIKTGIEVLKSQNFKILEGKRVGLITNPTGIDNNLTSTVDKIGRAHV